MIREQDCTNYEPGDITLIYKETLSRFLLRDGRKDKRINGLWLGGKDDNQRRTEHYYIYAEGNRLNGI